MASNIGHPEGDAPYHPFGRPRRPLYLDVRQVKFPGANQVLQPPGHATATNRSSAKSSPLTLEPQPLRRKGYDVNEPAVEQLPLPGCNLAGELNPGPKGDEGTGTLWAYSARGWWRWATAKASVLPEPVGALPETSRTGPMMSAMAAAWTGSCARDTAAYVERPPAPVRTPSPARSRRTGRSVPARGRLTILAPSP